MIEPMRRSAPSVWLPVLSQEVVRVLLFPVWWYTDGVLLLVRWFRDGLVPSVRLLLVMGERQRLFWRLGDVTRVITTMGRMLLTGLRVLGEGIVYVLLLTSWVIVLPVALAMILFGG